MLSIAQIEAALVELNFSFTFIERLGGYSNVNLLVKRQEASALVLKVLQQSNRIKAEEEYALLRALHQLGVHQVPLPVKGSLLPEKLSIENKQWELRWYEYVPGRIASPWYECPEETVIKSAFEDLAKLHVGLAQIHTMDHLVQDQKELHEAILSQWNRVLFSWPSLCTIEFELLWIEQSARIRKELRNLMFLSNAPLVYVHGDVHTENYLVHPNGNTWLDFEHLTLGYQGLELGLAAVKFCKFGEKDTPLQISKEGFQLAIQSYGNVTAIDTRHYVDFNFWKAYFALEECLLYFEKAITGTWKLIPEIGFYPCLMEVMNYKKVACVE
jgi:aminoglycoside phosphotransferase (APT) family kinase protein